MPSVLDRRTERFEERDSFHRALLGLRAVCERFETLVSSLGKPASSATTSELDDPLLVVLGAVVVHRMLAARLEAILAPQKKRRARRKSRAALSGLLR
jgi:hypothetical protein